MGLTQMNKPLVMLGGSWTSWSVASSILESMLPHLSRTHSYRIVDRLQIKGLLFLLLNMMLGVRSLRRPSRFILLSFIKALQS